MLPSIAISDTFMIYGGETTGRASTDILRDMAGRRRPSLLSGRLRGGFLASSLPGHSSSSSDSVSEDGDAHLIYYQRLFI